MATTITLQKYCAMDAEMTAFATDVLESIKQAKSIESEQIHALNVSKTPDKNTDVFEIKRLDVELRSINLGN